VGDDSMMKLELAIIENLQREDLNAVERARAFAKLVEEFKFTHAQIGQKVGKSREYVSNSLRLLALPQEFLDALSVGKINEGHTRPLLMLASRPEEQMTLFKEITLRKISVREAERIARRIAVDKVRKHALIPNNELLQIEQQLQESFGTRVHIEPREVGGKITIDYFSQEDLDVIIGVVQKKQQEGASLVTHTEPASEAGGEEMRPHEEKELLNDQTKEEEVKLEEDIDDLYNIKNFSL